MAAVPIGPAPGSNFLGFIDISHATHFLKLRQSFKASKQLRIELGVDWNIKTNQTKPYSGIKLLLNETKPTGWAIEMNTDWGLIQTPQWDPFSFTDELSLPLSLRVGTDFYNNDSAHFEVGMHNGKVAACLLAAMLYLQKPIKITRKEAGLWTVGLPITYKGGKTVDHTVRPGMEIDAMVQRRGKALKVNCTQLNAILRMTQDD